MELLIRFKIPNYPRKYKAGNKERPRFYEQDKDLPNVITKGISEGKIHFIPFQNKMVAAYTMDNIPLIKNAKTVGKAVYKTINGNELHSLNMPDYVRSNIINTIKDYVIPIINGHSFWTLVKQDYPIAVKFVYVVPRNEISDLDNHKLFYEKCILDLLQPVRKNVIKDEIGNIKAVQTDACNIIPNDNVDYVTQLHSIYIPSLDDKATLFVELLRFNDGDLDYIHNKYRELV